MSAYYSPRNATCVIVITQCLVCFKLFGLLSWASYISVCVLLQFCIWHAITDRYFGHNFVSCSEVYLYRSQWLSVRTLACNSHKYGAILFCGAVIVTHPMIFHISYSVLYKHGVEF